MIKRKETLKKHEKIKKRADFNNILMSGNKINEKSLKIYWSQNKKDFSRFAVITGKNLGKAVIRNRTRRLVREVYRKNKKIFDEKIDWIIIPKGNWQRINYKKAKNIITDAIKRRISF